VPLAVCPGQAKRCALGYIQVIELLRDRHCFATLVNPTVQAVIEKKVLDRAREWWDQAVGVAWAPVPAPGASNRWANQP
jgi:hypothetical protein